MVPSHHFAAAPFPTAWHPAQSLTPMQTQMLPLRKLQYRGHELVLTHGTPSDLNWPQRCACCGEAKLVVSNAIHPGTTSASSLYCDVCNCHVRLCDAAWKRCRDMRWRLGVGFLPWLVLFNVAGNNDICFGVLSLFPLAGIGYILRVLPALAAAVDRRPKLGCRSGDAKVIIRHDELGRPVIRLMDADYARDLVALNSR